MGDEAWIAGEIIVRNILSSMRELNDRSVTTSIIGGGNDAVREKYQSADEFICYTKPRRYDLGWARDQIAKRVARTNPSLEKLLKQNQVDVLFGSCLAFSYRGVATLSWLPDFQHVHLPDMFSTEERAARDETFERTARVSTRIILLSRAVQDDFRACLPRYAAKTRVLSPITRVPPKIYDDDPRDVLARYHLPEKFFYLPNQFWQHKNHESVFRAVKDLKELGVSITVVCTGFPSDHRYISNFVALWEQLSHWNIRDQIIYLGLVPHEDVLRLIRQAICVVNPSRFEGWGISVDEARSVGKRVIASNVPSHLEQNTDKALYFDPRDQSQLADLLEQGWKTLVPGPDLELEKHARLELPGRLRAFAQEFMAVCQEAMADLRIL